MHIDKLYFTLPEILERWSISDSDLIYLAENDRLRLSVRVYRVHIEFGAFEETVDGEPVRIPREQARYSGLLDLHAHDVHQLFRCGEVHLSHFRTPKADHATLRGEVAPVLVLIGDLLLRREERDRFEIQTGFSAAVEQEEERVLIASADYQEVHCNGHRFKLGPIQAEVVRALHEAAGRGESWQNGKVILSGAGSRSLRMADVFKSQANWRSLIRSDGRGGYRLNLD
ncbi:hypothetical protein [Paracoccus contaminans]|uniref:Uncharacterized protein n=1 Tax=Paracoccus contaminans TaxID=1945662 RepID=A0A1W6CZR6_9RHOB|nr:hypothetical protein [Paracoccus contaminans]ARJ70361.1 hypothetical protein B0A89_12715 [Paracoccus contaminans]